jgi:hypothetical protein
MVHKNQEALFFLGGGGAMEKQKKSAMVGIPVIILAFSAMFLSASPCAALEVPLPSGETTLDVDYTINEMVSVNSGGTLNLLDGGVINGYMGVESGGTLNIEGGQVNGDVYVAGGSEVNIKGGDIEGDIYPWDISVEAKAKVTVFGTNFDVTNGTIDPSGTYFTPDAAWTSCLLTGTYGGDAGDIDLLFYVMSGDVRIFLSPPDSEAMDVMIDIKPGSEQNNINLKSKGVVPVAVLTAGSICAEMIDPSTVEFAGATPERFSYEDIDNDGDDDIIFHFRTQELNLDEGSTEATLTAQLASSPLVSQMATQSAVQATGGAIVSGTDAVKIVAAKKSKK